MATALQLDGLKPTVARTVLNKLLQREVPFAVEGHNGPEFRVDVTIIGGDQALLLDLGRIVPASALKAAQAQQATQTPDEQAAPGVAPAVG